jgi:hypothetical protein
MEDDPEHPIVTLRVRPALNTMDLTVMTENELEEMRAFLNETIDMAVEVVRDLDRIAKEEFEAGRGIYKRLYRPEAKILRLNQPKQG